MQTAEVVLAILRKQSLQSQDFKFDRLYRNLFNPDFYMLAYSNLYAREGNMTPGTDGETIDGFSIKQVNGIIEAIRNETYTPVPSRRVYIPKRSGQLRPLGIPSFSDKIVQEVLRMLLVAIYEPLFKDSSHGFRQGKSCHTALLQIKKTCRGATWAVEGDIKGFFDNIDHDIMLKLISRKIEDGRIIELIRKFLKAGYFEFHRAHNSLSGTPQGGIISPVLANIYLHELDIFMEEVCNTNSTTKMRRNLNPEYRKLNQGRWIARKNGEYSVADENLKQMRKIPVGDPMDRDYIKVNYVRYADDFVVLINGSKDLAHNIKIGIGDFLKAELNLELNEEKTLVTHLSSERVRFLGYEIRKSQENSIVKEYSNGSKKRFVNGTMQLIVPSDVINAKLKTFKSGENKPMSRPERINGEVLNTLLTYNAEMHGLYNYYQLATDVSTKLNKFMYYHYYSLLRTIGRKEQMNIGKVLEKYGISVPRKQGTGNRKVFGISYETKAGTHTITYFNKSLSKTDTPVRDIEAEGLLFKQCLPRHQILDRLSAGKCELCGAESEDIEEFEVHHVRKLKEIQFKYRRQAIIPNWVTKMTEIHRKTLVVCKECHKGIHKAETRNVGKCRRQKGKYEIA